MPSRALAISTIIVAILAILLWILRPHSLEQNPRQANAQNPQPTARTSTSRKQNFKLTTIYHQMRATKQSQPKQIEGDDNIIPDQFTLIAKNQEQFAKLNAEILRRKLKIRNAIPALNAISLNIPRDLAIQLTREFDLMLEADTIVLIPEPPESTWSGRLGQIFGGDLLDWLKIDKFSVNKGDGIVVAILDTPLSNPDIPQIDLFGYARYSDFDNEHGNAVASILAPTTPLLQGVAPGIDLVSFPALDAYGEGSAFNLAAAIIAATDAGAHIISMSLGSTTPSSLLQYAVDYAHSNGTVLVAAAGNDGRDQLLYPANFENVIAVGAIDAHESAAEFSNTGDQLNIVAPGVGLLADASGNGDIFLFSGTSAAVPCVSGILANMLADNLDLTPQQAAKLLLDYATDSGKPGHDDQYGEGIIDYQRASLADTPGIIDAAAAGHYIDAENASQTLVPIIVSAQNTGTELLESMILETTLLDNTTSTVFKNVHPGEIVSTTLMLPIAHLENKAVALHSKVVLADDQRPENQTKTSVISLEK